MKSIARIIALSVILLILVTGTYALLRPTMVPAESPPTQVNSTTLLVPPDVRLLNIYCGAKPCILYWDTVSERFVAAFANGDVIYVIPAQ